MLTKISRELPPNPKPYIDLVREQIKTGQKYKDISGQPVALPEDFALNTLIQSVKSTDGEIEDLVVDYLGDRLILTDEQRENITPNLVTHLDMIGRAMFAPDSQGNLIINSNKARIDGNNCFIKDSNGAKVERSDLAMIINSHRATVKDSNEATVIDDVRIIA